MTGGDQEGVLPAALLCEAVREVRALSALACELLRAAESALLEADGGGVGRLDGALAAAGGSGKERFCPGSTLTGVAGEAAGGAAAACFWKKLARPSCFDIKTFASCSSWRFTRLRSAPSVVLF